MRRSLTSGILAIVLAGCAGLAVSPLALADPLSPGTPDPVSTPEPPAPIPAPEPAPSTPAPAAPSAAPTAAPEPAPSTPAPAASSAAPTAHASTPTVPAATAASAPASATPTALAAAPSALRIVSTPTQTTISGGLLGNSSEPVLYPVVPMALTQMMGTFTFQYPPGYWENLSRVAVQSPPVTSSPLPEVTLVTLTTATEGLQSIATEANGWFRNPVTGRLEPPRMGTFTVLTDWEQLLRVPPPSSLPSTPRVTDLQPLIPVPMAPTSVLIDTQQPAARETGRALAATVWFMNSGEPRTLSLNAPQKPAIRGARMLGTVTVPPDGRVRVDLPLAKVPAGSLLGVSITREGGGVSSVRLPVRVVANRGQVAERVRFAGTSTALSSTTRAQVRRLAAAAPRNATVSVQVLGLAASPTLTKRALARAKAVAAELAAAGVVPAYAVGRPARPVSGPASGDVLVSVSWRP